jgi:VCBS repeat-containing protein
MINITGTNDAPQITTGPVSASVTENVSPTATGTMAAFDPDTGAQDFWTVVGGTGAAAAAYTFVMDDLHIIKNGGIIFQDPFSDGSPPPSSPNFANGQPHTYAMSGAFQEAGGKLIIDAADASAAVSVGTTDPFIGNFATVRTNIDPADLVAGLKNDDDFTVEGLFDLVVPDSPREVYGIRLLDRLIGGPGTPPDQLGDDGIELVVRQGVDGILRVQLREIDWVNDQVVNIGGVVLSPPPGADQILLRLTHSTTDVGALHASFDYLAGGVVIGSESLAQIGRIFGTETPGFTGDDENWTRAQTIAYAPAVTDSTLAGAYGTLTIDQAGVWTYNLANNQIGVQNLAEGQTAVDTFTIQVADEHGASDTETISITVVGTNDAPVIVTGPVSRNLSEDEAPTLTATGDAFFFDVDLIDTHTFTPSLTSATLSNGASVSAGVLSAAGSALSATLLDPATGDSDGHYRWDFALDNAVVDFLASGETLTLTYDVAAMDNHGGTDTQLVTINIEGTDDWLVT